MRAAAVTREGEGREVLLVHGGASPETTWGALAPLRAHWTLVRVHRRGYPPSPDGWADFDVDAAALEVVRVAGIPSLVASGDHAPALERDALAAGLDAQRLVVPRAGHLVATAPGFADRLHEFLAAAA
jgi:pimeloyl-ACP methyl ester carboxylesterase